MCWDQKAEKRPTFEGVCTQVQALMMPTFEFQPEIVTLGKKKTREINQFSIWESDTLTYPWVYTRVHIYLTRLLNFVWLPYTHLCYPPGKLFQTHPIFSLPG